MKDSEGNLWIRDEGYGEPAFLGILSGLFFIVAGVVQFLVSLVVRRR